MVMIGRCFSNRTRQADYDARQNSGRGIRKEMIRDCLPFGRTKRIGALANSHRNGAYCLPGRDDNYRKDQ